MGTSQSPTTSRLRRALWTSAAAALLLAGCSGGEAPPGAHSGGEANLPLPDLGSITFFGLPGDVLLGFGLVVCALGLGFGVLTYSSLKKMPAHAAMREISELIYTTCKAYLKQQGKFLFLLWAFIATIIVVYYLFLVDLGIGKTAIVIAFSLIGMAGSYGVAWYGIRVNTLANSRTAHAALGGKPYPLHDIPLRSGMSIGMVLISVELAMMLVILVFLPPEIAGACFIGFAIGESLGASALRIAGGIFTKIADIGADLMKIVFRIKEDDARNPGVIADCTGDNAGDSVGPSADGFETYGVTGVALITFILLGVPDQTLQIQLLVWIFVIRAVMVVASGLSYFINHAITKARYGDAEEMDFERPLTTLVWGGAIGSLVFTLALPWYWEPALAQWQQMGPWPRVVLLSTGVWGALGHLLQISAYRNAPASLLAPFTYLQIVAATTLGWLVWRQFPDALTWLGIALVIASGVGVMLRELRGVR